MQWITGGNMTRIKNTRMLASKQYKNITEKALGYIPSDEASPNSSMRFDRGGSGGSETISGTPVFDAT